MTAQCHVEDTGPKLSPGSTGLRLLRNPLSYWRGNLLVFGSLAAFHPTPHGPAEGSTLCPSGSEWVLPQFQGEQVRQVQSRWRLVQGQTQNPVRPLGAGWTTVCAVGRAPSLLLGGGRAATASTARKGGASVPGRGTQTMERLGLGHPVSQRTCHLGLPLRV